MDDSFEKLWLQGSLNSSAINRASEAIQQTGRALPCHVTAVTGSIVTVEFEVDAAPWVLPPITIPKSESNWIRSPTQVGDKGWTIPADVYLGGVSGLGGGTATLQRRANMSALVFSPISNANAPPIDQNAAQIQGPNGAIIQTSDGTSSIVTDSTGTTIKIGSVTAVITGTTITFTAPNTLFDGNLEVSGNISGGTGTGGGTATFSGDITTTGDVKAGSISLTHHKHLYTPGTGTPTDTGEAV